MNKRCLFIAILAVTTMVPASVLAMQALKGHDEYWQGSGTGNGVWFRDIASTRNKVTAAAFENPCETLKMLTEYRRRHNVFYETLAYIRSGHTIINGANRDVLQPQAGDNIQAAIMRDASRRIASDVTFNLVKAMCEDAEFMNMIRSSGSAREFVTDLIYWGHQTDDPARRQRLREATWNESQANFNRIASKIPGYL